MSAAPDASTYVEHVDASVVLETLTDRGITARMRLRGDMKIVHDRSRRDLGAAGYEVRRGKTDRLERKG